MEFRISALALVFLMVLAPVPGRAEEGAAPFAGPGAAGEEAGAADTGTPAGDAGEEFFPLSLLIETAASGHIPWRPDWPPAIAPDAFRVSVGEVSALSLGLDTGEYRFRRGEGGWIEFPAFLRGSFYQAQALFAGAGAVSRITVLAEEPWELDILAYADGRPSLIRAAHGERVYFTVPEYRERWVSETWYDREGNAAAVFFLEYTVSGGREGLRGLKALKEGGEETETYDYDNRGNISALSSPGGEFSALYTSEDLPRYWERRPLPEEEAVPVSPAGEVLPVSPEGTGETYALHWDERGLLVRITGTVAGAAGAEPVDLRYEYSLDERGNWTRRRETRMLRRFGVLVPGPGTELTRTIEYGE
jgi:hypothetical protein